MLFWWNCLAVMLILGTLEIQCDQREQEWIEPNAWSREEHSMSLSSLNVKTNNGSPCPKCEPAECSLRKDNSVAPQNDISFIFYKKFIANLFNRNKLEYDESRAIFKRSIRFKLQPAQLDQLEQLQDPRDLDIVLTEIFMNAHTYLDNGNLSTDENSFLSLIWDIIKDLAQLLKTSEAKFLLLVATAILLGCFLHRRYKIGIIAMIISCMLLYGYFYTYLECNKKLEVEQMLEVLEQSEHTPEIESSWWSNIKTYFGYQPSTIEHTKERLRKSSKINVAYCRPDHVAIMYVNDLFLKQLEFLLEKCTSTFVTLKDKLTFPYNYIASIMLFFMVAYIIKLTFKYILSPKAWASLFHRHIHMPGDTYSSPRIEKSTSQIQIEDRISGENLKLLLNAIGGSGANNIVKNGKPVLAVSGVEEVNENADTVASFSSASSSKTNSPNKDSSDQRESDDTEATAEKEFVSKETATNS